MTLIKENNEFSTKIVYIKVITTNKDLHAK